MHLPGIVLIGAAAASGRMRQAQHARMRHAYTPLLAYLCTAHERARSCAANVSELLVGGLCCAMRYALACVSVHNMRARLLFLVALHLIVWSVRCLRRCLLVLV